MFGPGVIARTLTDLMGPDKRFGNRWQYQPRSDRHSKIACWSILFDIVASNRLIARQLASGEIGFGINHEMRDFKTSRKKDLDLVICTPGSSNRKKNLTSFRSLVDRYEIRLDSEEEAILLGLPDFQESPVGEVHVALEAKACMTAHSKARPRLYDELSSSHLTIHGSSRTAIAVGFVMVNASETFISPDLNKFSIAERPPEYSTHKQPADTLRVIEKVQELQRRSDTSEAGFDALGLVVVNCVNDGSPVEIVSGSPAPVAGEVLHYDAMIRKVTSLYQSRFPQV